MRSRHFLSLVFIGVFGWSLASCTSSKNANPPKDEADSAVQTELKGTIMLEMQTSEGAVKIELYPEKAPKTVQNFLKYVESGYYKGTVFHRVIDGFMIQGGGMTPELQAKPTEAPVENESGNGLKNEPMTLAMARTNDPDSATSQFFINLENNEFLNAKAGQPGYAVFGKVVEGEEIVRKIGKTETTTKGYYDDVPVKPIVIQDVQILK